MDNSTLTFIVSVAGGIIGLSFVIIGFFLSRLVGDVKHTIEETGKNKGRIDLINQQQKNDTRRIEEMTQLELKLMSHNISELSKNVNTLVTALAKKGIDSEN